ncbi:MAG: copper homeostasis protein CutC [Flavobacteriaceae bacterium]|jgi:copper homeostasis protein|nr:copper homeostasis protein CutC [Flavobacteriaceae bacterium]MBT4112430.1 copper homeostasis protein CutC [Flavobacteriaceae bacterium]MBT4614284.1 copper homeostasis protein CutC [Flavobacteriaceae bacterium]MBT5246737.1 copper homeostasis protein CutC [Flavobacteriaceae bacterium]MBT5649922.1 copper homeostasis protein CutC [Flavobacteriaceae bacterium]
MIVEVCANSYEYAVNAELGGANRIELCKDLHLDGLTPDDDISVSTINKLKIPVFILIRPRGGDFVYNNEEFELMKNDIKKFKKLGCSGIVSGVLNTDNTIDIKRTKELIELSKPLEFTFHRAFDKIVNPIEGVDQLIKLGVNRILTSGQEGTAIKGLKLLKKLNKINNNRIIILPGAGMKTKFFEIFSKAGFKEIHGSFKSEIKKV